MSGGLGVIAAVTIRAFPPSAFVTVVVVVLLSVIGLVVALRRPAFDRRSLLVQAIALALGEVTIYTFYIGFRQPFHWANHLLPAVVVASVVYLIFLVVKDRPMRGEVILVLPLHLFSMVPDPMFSFNTLPHQEWMNVFTGHIWVHFLPFRLNGWLVLALLASGVYVFALVRWIGRRGAPGAAASVGAAPEPAGG